MKVVRRGSVSPCSSLWIALCVKPMRRPSSALAPAKTARARRTLAAKACRIELERAHRKPCERDVRCAAIDGLSCLLKNPRQFPAEGLCSEVHDHAIRDRSRDGRGSGTTSCPGRPRRKAVPADQRRTVGAAMAQRAAKADQSGSEVGAMHLGVHHVHAHVEVLGDVPLRPRTDPPSLPVQRSQPKW